MSQRTSPLPEPTSADASRQGSQASEEPSLTGRCSASEQTLHGGPYPLRQQTSAVEFYDMAVDDEPGDRAASVASETWDEQKVQHISAGLDFLGFVENKKTGASRVLLSTDAEEVCSDSCTTQREGATRSNEGAKKRSLDVRTRGGTVAETSTTPKRTGEEP